MTRGRVAHYLAMVVHRIGHSIRSRLDLLVVLILSAFALIRVPWIAWKCKRKATAFNMQKIEMEVGIQRNPLFIQTREI
jgi:hypothetical protein